MNTINCLIVDDEPLARELIAGYCSHIPALRVSGVCGNAFEARKILQESRIDILFLDIHLPVLDGIGFLTTLKEQPQVIMTTAYKEYAVNAFDLAVCDYLVKPFSLQRFIIAVDKAIARLVLLTPAQTPLPAPTPLPAGPAEKTGMDDHYLFIKTDGKIYRIEHDELLFAEANGNYTKIVTVGTTIMPLMVFAGLEKMLPGDRFLRVHRSFIINKSKIAHIEGNRVFIGEYEIPISKNYRDGFLQQLGL